MVPSKTAVIKLVWSQICIKLPKSFGLVRAADEYILKCTPLPFSSSILRKKWDKIINLKTGILWEPLSALSMIGSMPESEVIFIKLQNIGRVISLGPTSRILVDNHCCLLLQCSPISSILSLKQTDPTHRILCFFNLYASPFCLPMWIKLLSH